MKVFKSLLIYITAFFGLIQNLHAVNEKEDFVYDLSLATQGVSVSQYNTGVNYYIGRGIAQDMEKAVYWSQRASKQGHSKAPFNIAIIYGNGEVTDKNLALALEYFLMAAERGNEEAKELIKKLEKDSGLSMEESLAKICCPKPLSHSMVSKN